MAVPTWHSIALTPIVMVWPHLYANFLLGMWIIEIFWVADFVICFFKASENMKSVEETALNYLMGPAIVDLLAILVPLSTGQALTVNVVKLLRIIHFRYFTAPVDMLLFVVVKNNFMRKSY
jgi:hypothetical protein